MNKRAVKYLLIGGYAVGYYGYPRATADIDIWTDPEDSENLDNLVLALNDFGLRSVSKDNIIALCDLKENKKASGRHKDLNDLENLP